VGNIPEKGTWYRVRIGGFPSREEAQKFLDKFKAKEKASALVVLSNS
jgi:cell division protein FtsN